MDYLVILIGFLAGFAVRGFLSQLHMIGSTGEFTKRVAAQAELLLVTVAQDIEFIKTAKYQALNDSGSDRNLVIREKNMDDYMFDKWKKTVVKTYIENYPKEFRKHHVKFCDWETMVQEFNKKR